MAALLALVPFKDWVYIGIIAALFAAGAYERNHLIDEGKAHEAAALKLSSDKLQKQTAAQTADLQAKATMAEQAYEKERAASLNLPPVQPVRLCNSAPSRNSVVSQATGQKPGDASAGTGTTAIQSVSSGNSSSGQSTAGPDISSLLGLLAARGDQVSATLREYQNRE